MTMLHDYHDIRPTDGTGTGFDRLLTQLAAPPTRRTKKLMRADTGRKARKLVEEAAEVSLDAVTGNRQGVINESVDLLYHLAVLWRDQAIDPAEVWAEMDRRRCHASPKNCPGRARRKRRSRPRFIATVSASGGCRSAGWRRCRRAEATTGPPARAGRIRIPED